MLAKDTTIQKAGILTKVKDYAMLVKLRLSLLVVISAIATWFFAGGQVNFYFVLLVAGGFLITGSSNAFNQVLERDLDAKMDRTKDRPLPAGRMGVAEALVVAFVIGAAGLLMLFSINFLSGILGLLAMVLYVVIYTPMKQITPWAVFTGAFPGAIPPMLGVVAATGAFNFEAGLMFLVQFAWQFPHFWAIAWITDADYAKAGFSLLPSKGRKNKASAFQVIVYSAFLVPISLLPWAFGMTGKTSLIVGTILGLWFFMTAYRLYLTLEDKSARALMFASFIYLPVIQFLYVFDKIQP